MDRRGRYRYASATICSGLIGPLCEVRFLHASAIHGYISRDSVKPAEKVHRVQEIAERICKMAKDDVLIIGLGEVGRPLLELLAEKHPTIGIDIEPVTTDGVCRVLHICYPFTESFVGTTVKYIEEKGPSLTIINSTIAPGTTRAIYGLTHRPVAYSPVRGKHFKMGQDMLHYAKFVGGINKDSSLQAAEHFQSIGMKTKTLSSPEAAELAKLTETTYFGLQIAYAQELERYCNELSVEYDEVVSFFDEVPFLPNSLRSELVSDWAKFCIYFISS